MDDLQVRCAICAIAREEKACRTENGKGPKFCPTLHKGEVVSESIRKYEQEEFADFARQASIQESSCYINREDIPHVLHPVKTRVQEICEFAHRMGYHKLGLAFCAGLHTEAAILTSILEKASFEVVSVVCKVGCVSKETIGIKEEEKVSVGSYESMCNPITQADILNEAATEFNIILGLCVGHDSMFIKNSKAMVTIFAVKDRVMGHNPIAALYTSHSYSQRFLKKPFETW